MRGDRSTVRAIRGPITLITVGVLFALQNFTPYGFEQTWPVLLIVFGLLSLIGRGVPQQPPPPPPPPYNFPPAGGARPQPYTQTGYSQAPPPAAQAPQKGGFGGSAYRNEPPSESNPGGTQ
jgi:hypothetical protein